MNVLTLYAHHDPESFCHGVLERFTAGLTDAGHSSEVVDLHAIKFDPVFRDRDVASYTSGTIPPDILELMDLQHRVLRSCRGRLQRFLATRAMGGKCTLGDRGHDPKPDAQGRDRAATEGGGRGRVRLRRPDPFL